jgi:hypothetical protein
MWVAMSSSKLSPNKSVHLTWPALRRMVNSTWLVRAGRASDLKR